MQPKTKHSFYSVWKARYDEQAGGWNCEGTACLTGDYPRLERTHTVRQFVPGGKTKGTRRVCAALVNQALLEFDAILAEEAAQPAGEVR